MSYIAQLMKTHGFNPSEQTGIVGTLLLGTCAQRCGTCITKWHRRGPIPSTPIPLEVIREGLDSVQDHIEVFLLQGDEVCQGDTIDDALALIADASAYDIPSGAITSGTHFYPNAFALADAGAKISLSLDGPPYIHALIRERIRPKTEASAELGWQYFHDLPPSMEMFNRTFPECLTVASILHPRRKQQLLQLPKLLQYVGVRSWVGSALVSCNEKGSAFAHNPKKVFALARELDAEAKQWGLPGITFMNEHKAMLDGAIPEDITAYQLARPHLIIRLDQVTHRLGIGPKQISSMGPEVPTWDYRTESLLEHLARRLGTNMPEPRAKLTMDTIAA